MFLHTLTAIFASGALAGILILACLAMLSLCRALVSLTSKDIAGRVVPKGYRGRLTGFATTVSGGWPSSWALCCKLSSQNSPQRSSRPFCHRGSFVGAELVAFPRYSGAGRFGVSKKQVAEEQQAQQEAQEAMQTPAAYVREVIQDIKELLAGDRTFRSFVLVRTLLLTSALSPTFLVAMAAANQDRAGNSVATALFTGLGTFVIASGVASLLAGKVSGWLSDVSSRNTLAGAALLATVVLVITVALSFVISLVDAAQASSLHPTGYLLS